MKRILSILSTFLFALVLTLTSCTKENLRTSNECDICGTWKFDSIVVPSQVNSCGITTDYDNSPFSAHTINFTDKPGNIYQIYTNTGDTSASYYVNYIDSDSINFTDTPYWTFSFKIQINSNKMTMTGLKHQNDPGLCDRTEIWYFTKN